VDQEERFKRVKALEKRAKFYRWVAAAFTLGVVASGVLLDGGDRALALVLAAYLIAVAAALRAYTLESHIEEVWKEVLGEDSEWLKRDALTLVVMATIALMAVLLARALGG